MKRTRQLFVALPLIPFPLVFDEFSKQLPSLLSTTMTTKLPSAVNAAANSSVNNEVVTQAIGQTVRIKIAAGVVGITLLAGSGVYWMESDDVAAPGTRADAKNVTKPNDPQAKEPVEKNTGSLTLVAKLSQNSQQNLKNVKWKLEPLNPDPSAKGSSQKPIGALSKKTNGEVSYTLLPGSYKVISSLGGLKKSEIVNVEKGKSSISPVVFDAGEINVAMPLNKDFDIADVQWHLYKGEAASPIATFSGNFREYLFAGKYVLRASYRGYLEKRHEFTLAPGQITPVAKPGFSYGKLKLQAKLGKSGKMIGSATSAQWSVDRLVNGKVDENNIVKIDKNQAVVLLAPGNYRINISLGKHVNQSADVVIREGETNAGTRLVVNAGKLVLQAKIILRSPLLPAYVN